MSGTQGGYYLMARGWMDHPVLATKEPFSRREAWAWIIESAAYSDTRTDVLGQIVAVQRGQISQGFRAIAKAWGWEVARVQRFISRLKAEGMIDTATDTGRLMITVCNYDRYQAPWGSADTPGDTPAIRHRYASESQKKEGKEGKESPPPAPPRAREADPWEEPELVATIEEPPPLRVVHDADQPRHAPAPPPASRTPVNGGYGPGWDWQPDARGRDACARHGIDVEWAREKFVAVFQATPPIRPVVLEARFISFVLEEANRDRQAGGLRRGGAAAHRRADQDGLRRAEQEVALAVTGDPNAHVTLPRLSAAPRRAYR